MKRTLLVIFLAVDASFLACYAVAFFRQEQSENPSPPTLAQNTPPTTASSAAAPAQPAGSSPGEAAAVPKGDFFGTRDAETEPSSRDGKEVIDAKDGKELMPVAAGADPKDPLPPIADFTEAVKSGYRPITPGTEYFPKTPTSGSGTSRRGASGVTASNPGITSAPSNAQARLLSAPNPGNIIPLVVSPETP